MIRIIVFIALWVPVFVAAEIYKSVDENGRVIFTDKPSATADRIEVDVNVVSSVRSNVKATRSEQVVMYSTSWCGVCKQAKKYMQSKGIRFIEYDIEKSARKQREFKKLGGQGVPLILVGNQKMSGFSQGRLDAMLVKAELDLQ